MKYLILACALALGGCAVAGKADVDAAQPDVAKIKIYWPAIGGTSAAIEKTAASELDAYRDAHGYRSYAVLDKRYNVAPTYIEYTARFEK